MGIAASILRVTIRGYQLFLSPLCTGSCRYLPSCSHYAMEAVETHGAGRGGWLALRRFLRCHPWGGDGYDPVPPGALNSATMDDGNRPTAPQLGLR